MKLEHFNWFLCHAHSWGISLVQLLAFFTWWKNKNLKCQRRAANEKLISDSGGFALCVRVCSGSWVQGKTSHCNVPFPPPPPKAYPCSLVLLPIPTAGVRGESKWGKCPFSPRLDMPGSLDSNHSKCMKVCCFWMTSSVFVFLPDLRGVILAAAAPWWPHSSEIWLSPR